MPSNIFGSTRILGIFGDPVAHSLSPLMQNQALRQAGIDAVYVPFHVRPADLAGAVAALRHLNILGVNVTVPHKEAVLPLLDEVDENARLIGAVNTIVNRAGHLHGYNTDGEGFLHSLRDDLGFEPAARRVLLLGAGGACRAALVVLAQAGVAEIRIANRNVERAQTLIDSFAATFPGTTFAALPLAQCPEFQAAAADIDLLVNTTSLGLAGEEILLPWEGFPPRCAVYDMVYRRGGTVFCRRAAAKGHLTADGLGMLAAQGERAFELWTGQPPPFGVMKSRLLAEPADN
ncbi:shikimate dehydrogenase [Geoalkalibacter halelectricus]|uniref:Shikimate dehydrogenase (NADP(+)) n=1 Tax=Geoalkalibacter halelectricus TaxID=2847045 RepID=A0ABY5ZTM1_9BACT|nr:shikimate dehydrogenase [Geoalkalibacter halelectricus]MDO3376783.1 shikimate dehydrogenase [Geoalkalibacter halelectricus]UWZ81265.1 shikimate dehydrogenase [Geoalkalibacter halelectricus]